MKKTSGGKELKILKEQLARALADYDNLEKRVARERSEIRFMLLYQIVGNFLPALDMLYGAQEHLKDAGLGLTIKEFEDRLKEEGVEKIDVKVGDKFDETKSEAIDSLENKEKEGTIAEVQEVGWQIDGKPMRFAKVKVFK